MGDRKHQQQAKSHRLIVLGDGAVGKSCMTIRFTRAQFVDDYDPTIEDAYKKQCVIDGQAAMLDILDTAGQEEYSSMREQYMHNGDGFLCVYSIVSKDTLNNINKLVRQILRVKDADHFPIVLVGNKCDLEEERQVTFEEGQRLAEELGGLPFLETSAKLGINVDKAFYELVRSIRKHKSTKAAAQPKKMKKACVIL